MTEKTRKKLDPMLPAERRSVGVIALIAMLRMFGLFALLPVLALYAAGLSGATPALIGIAVGGYGLTQAALQIPFGALSDRIGRRPVIVTGLLIFAIGSVIAGMSDTIYGVIGGRLLQGAGAVSATLTALLADSTRESVRTRSMAFFGIGIGMAFLLALILGPVIAAVAGTQSLFWMAAGIALFSAMLLSLVPAAESPPSPAYSVGIKAAFKPDLLRIDVYVFILHAMMTSIFVALPFLLQNVLGMDLVDHWMIYVGALLASLVGTVPLIISDDRQGKSSVMSIAILLLLAAMLSLVFVPPTKLSVFASLAVFFAGFNFLEAGLPARLSLLAEGSIRGAAMGVFSSSQFLGAFVGGVMGGLLLASQAGNSVFIAGSVAAAGWLGLHLSGRQS